MADTATLQELRSKIRSERKFVDVKPYSHNIVSLALQRIANKFGQAEANKAVRDFQLARLGWREHP